MNVYSIYGACLATNVPFPELRHADAGTPKWTFEMTAHLEPAADEVELGAEHIYGDVHARLFRHAAGHRISVDDTGVFDLSPDGRRIRWEDRAESWPDFVRAHLMGRVLATSLFLDGWLPLHGSAVAFREGVVAFLAPKGYGKSSLALALTRMGAQLVTDDTLPLEIADVPMAWPGVHSVRVRADSLAAIGESADGVLTREGKTVISDIPLESLSRAAAPLRALYVLQPVEGESVDTTRVRLPETLAALVVVAHVKIARMLGASAAPELLERAAAIVRAVPAFRLTAPRDLSCLPATAACIAEWHGGVRDTALTAARE